MPNVVKCPGCGKSLKIPDSAAGKRAKCPGCETIIRIPPAALDAEEVTDGVGPQGIQGPPGGFDPADLDDGGYAMSPEPAGVPQFSQGPQGPQGPDQRRPCPACGEMIVAGAAKCRFCGEIFDPTLKRKARTGGVDDDMTTGDWVVAILCSGIGCIAGIVWMIQGKKKGAKMVGVSVCANIVWVIIRIILEAAAQ